MTLFSSFMQLFTLFSLIRFSIHLTERLTLYHFEVIGNSGVDTDQNLGVQLLLCVTAICNDLMTYTYRHANCWG